MNRRWHVRNIPLLAAFLVAAGVTHVPASSSACYLCDEMAAALTARDQFFGAIATAAGLPSPDFGSRVNSDAVWKALKATKDTRNPWYSLVAGASEPNPANARIHFRNALVYAYGNAGVTWALYYEFTRRGQRLLADSALAQLERTLLARGAESVPALGQQFMFDAVMGERKGDAEAAAAAWNRTRNFDQMTVWPALWSIRQSVLRPAGLTEGLSELAYVFGHSTETQVDALQRLLSLVFRIVQALVTGVFFAMFFKYFARGIHPYAERFPKAIPMLLRTALVGCLALSLTAFGVVPFIWLLAFIVWPHMAQRERLVAGVCLVCITLSPVGALMETALRVYRAPSNTPHLYARAIREGYSADLHRTLADHARQHENDATAQLACAISAVKGDSLRAAQAWMERARQLRPQDPVVMNVWGIVQYALGDRKAGRESFEQCTRTFPEFAPAYLNLGKTMLDAMETLKGADLFSQASRIDKRYVERFVKKNDMYFGQQPPWSRHFLIGDYPPGYFWRNLFPRRAFYPGIWRDTSRLWGITFLGLPPLVSLGIFAGFLVVLLIREGVTEARSRSRVKVVFVCELCGAAMCKLCARGPYCRSCYDSLSAIQIEQRRQAAKVQLFRRARLREVWAACILDVIFPGTGMLFERSISHRTSAVFLAISATLYGLLLMSRTATYAYPLWVAEGMFAPVVVVAGLYAFGFAVRGFAKVRRSMATQEM